MQDKSPYTPEEVAGILKISKYTVYEMIKRGDLPAYHIGRKVRVRPDDLDNFMNGGIKPGSSQKENNLTQTITINATKTIEANQYILCGHDPVIDILVKYLEAEMPGFMFLRNHVGSMQGLQQLYSGQAHATAVHLWDGDRDEYNIPYIRYSMPGIPFTLIHILKRYEGFFVRKGNPKKIKAWEDFTRKDIRIVNREPGSGVRVLMDEKLRILQINASKIDGYDDVETSHFAVASKIARGLCDVGIGTERTALQVKEIDFIPMQVESYQLVVPSREKDTLWMKKLLQILKSDKFRSEIEGISCYDTSEMGTIVTES